MGTTETRLLMSRSRVTCAARAKAASTAAWSPQPQRRATLSGAASWSRAASGETALARSVHRRQRLDLDQDRLDGIQGRSRGLCHHHGERWPT
jgi:hypothetical protein